MKKKIVLAEGFLPEGTIPYKGQYIYKVKAFREGRSGLGPGYPQPEFLELELEGVGGIDGKLERVIPVSTANPLDCRNHKYYMLEHEVWIKNLGGGKYAKPELLDGTTVTCCDGLCYDAKRNRIILTAAAQNALYAWNISAGRMELVWANGDTDGADGLFDQPSEVLFLPDGRLVVVNIDAPSPGMVNSGADKVHTLSVIDGGN